MDYLARVASAVVFVSTLDRSVDFYRDVFACQIAIHDPGAALLTTPGGFQIYLIERGRRAQHPSGHIGVQYLMWATDHEEGLQQFERALKERGVHTSTHASGGVRFLEARDPDGIRIVIAQPGPQQLPRSVLAAPLYN